MPLKKKSRYFSYIANYRLRVLKGKQAYIYIFNFAMKQNQKTNQES